MAMTATEIEIRRIKWDRKFQKELRKYFKKFNKIDYSTASYMDLRMQLNEAINNSNLYNILYNLWIGTVNDFGRFVFGRLKNQKAFNLLEFGALSYIQGVVFNRIQRINDYSKKVLSNILDTAMEEGLSIPNTVKAIKEQFTSWSKWRATRIARTEVVSASNFGSLQGAKQSGAEVKKVWIATFDSRVRKTHKKAHGQTAAMGEKFKVGNAELEFPGDPRGPAKEVINCRCALGYKEVQG